jgi:hypothetical protein
MRAGSKIFAAGRRGVIIPLLFNQRLSKNRDALEKDRSGSATQKNPRRPLHAPGNLIGSQHLDDWGSHHGMNSEDWLW